LGNDNGKNPLEKGELESVILRGAKRKRRIPQMSFSTLVILRERAESLNVVFHFVVAVVFLFKTAY
jgi:hypothetical protein